MICHADTGSGPTAPEPGKNRGNAQGCQLCPAANMPAVAVLPVTSPSVVWLTGTRPTNRLCHHLDGSAARHAPGGPAYRTANDHHMTDFRVRAPVRLCAIVSHIVSHT